MGYRITIYVDFNGGRYEAYYWHTDECRNFYFTSHNEAEAIRECAEHTGYPMSDCKLVTIHNRNKRHAKI